jgi:hypothetical protein
MLERAKLQPQQCTVDPLDNAARWSIPIWPLEKVSILSHKKDVDT